ncbi:hypothetical protein M747DRAFT_129469 [Aspergillus niger ATCC 13496]|uniref:Uncharacterized protein n=1 Tax=Aspergillus niger ATCC 13496 TaxID=1353008 RepID=A0A370BNK2_ASPNG|nr:hypothetical protein M747DRAFT_129469 [Aspergillus niger ATCC 13496]
MDNTQHLPCSLAGRLFLGFHRLVLFMLIIMEIYRVGFGLGSLGCGFLFSFSFFREELRTCFK